MTGWCEYLRDEISLTPSLSTYQLLWCCRLFAMHFDRHLNAACAGRPVLPAKVFQRHLELGSKGLVWYIRFSGEYFNAVTLSTLRRVAQRLPCPYWSSALPWTFRYFVMFMFSVFIRSHWVLVRPMIVYRCLRLSRDGVVDWHFCGFTSTSYVLTDALQFVVHGEKPYDDAVHRCVVLEIALPPGVRFIPMSLMTIQEEHEILVISQGRIHAILPAVPEQIAFWCPITTDRGDNVLHYERIQCELVVEADMPELKE